MARTFPCPHCQSVLTPVSEADFHVHCPTCNKAVSPPWVPSLALDDAAAARVPPVDPTAIAATPVLPVGRAVEAAVPTLMPVEETAPSGTLPLASSAVPVDAAATEEVPILEEADPPTLARPQALDWAAVAPVEAPQPAKLEPGWKRIPAALNFINVGSGVLLVTLLFFLVLAAVAGVNGLKPRTPGGPLQVSLGTHHGSTISLEVVLVILGGALLLGGFFLVVGTLICCRVPRESQGRGLAVLAALCLFSGLGIQLAAGVLNVGLAAEWPQVLELREQYPEPVAAVASFGLLGGLAFFAVEAIFFLLFLRNVGLFFSDKRVPRSVLRYFTFTILAPLVPLVCIGLAYLLTLPGARKSGMDHHELTAAINVCLALVPIALFAYIVALGIWYIVLVRATRDLVHGVRLGRVG